MRKKTAWQSCNRIERIHARQKGRPRLQAIGTRGYARHTSHRLAGAATHNAGQRLCRSGDTRCRSLSLSSSLPLPHRCCHVPRRVAGVLCAPPGPPARPSSPSHTACPAHHCRPLAHCTHISAGRGPLVQAPLRVLLCRSAQPCQRSQQPPLRLVSRLTTQHTQPSAVATAAPNSYARHCTHTQGLMRPGASLSL